MMKNIYVVPGNLNVKNKQLLNKSGDYKFLNNQNVSQKLSRRVDVDQKTSDMFFVQAHCAIYAFEFKNNKNDWLYMKGGGIITKQIPDLKRIGYHDPVLFNIDAFMSLDFAELSTNKLDYSKPLGLIDEGLLGKLLYDNNQNNIDLIHHIHSNYK